jgi:hypothetical protein
LGFLEKLRGSAELPAVERRRNVRLSNVFQVAKIAAAGLEELCIVRDVSAGGLRAQVYHPLATGTAVTVELSTGVCVAGRVVWADDDQVGVAFDAPVSVLSLLSHCSHDERVGVIRPPRIAVDLPVTLTFGGYRLDTVACDVSLAGAKLRHADPIAPDTPCQVTLPLMGPRPAMIRWQRTGLVGVQFGHALPFAEFGRWRRLLDAPEPLAA